MAEQSKSANRVRITPTRAKQFVSSGQRNQRLWDTEVKGLHLRIYRPGIAAWIYRYKSERDGRWREMKIGDFPQLTVDPARKAAQVRIGQVANAIDPIDQQRQFRADLEKHKRLTVRAYLDGPYALYLKTRKGGDSTSSLIKNHFPKWLDRSMTSFKPDELAHWQAERQQEGKSWGTVKRAWDAMRAMLNYAAKKGHIETNPLSGHGLDKPATTQENLNEVGKERRYLDSHEITALFRGLDLYQEQRREERRSSRQHGKRHLPDLDAVTYVDHVKPWILTMYYTGFRPGDLFGLRWEHVDLNFKNIRKIIEKTAHHKDKPQTFPLSDEAVKVLKIWWEQNGKPGSGYVFKSERTGERMDKGSMQRPWKRIKEAAGLDPDLHLYTLRHHFASALVLMGVDLLTVSRLMAHNEIQTTIEHYGHLQSDRAREIVNRFATPEKLNEALEQDLSTEAENPKQTKTKG